MTRSPQNFRLDYQVKPITTGATNNGMVVHSLSREGKRIVELVEKRSKVQREGLFYAKSYPILEASAINVPRLYRLEQDSSRGWTIFTEKVEGAMRIPSLDRDSATALGGYLAELALVQFSHLHKHHMARALDAGDIATAEQVCEGDEEKAQCRNILEFLPAIKARLAALPDVTSHNDLNWFNMAVPSDGFVTMPYIFDWDKVCLNCVGADLHFFAEQLLRKNNESLGRALFRGYAERLSRAGLLGASYLRENDLILSALVYGLAVRSLWIRKYYADKHRAPTRRTTLQLARHLNKLTAKGELG